MNFLKKLGLWLARGAEVAGEIMGFGPVVQLVTGFLPHGAQAIAQTGISDLSLIAKEIINVEGIFASFNDPSLKTGSQKLIAAAPKVALVMDTWARSGVLGSHSLKDKDKADAAVKQICSGMADYLSAYGE